MCSQLSGSDITGKVIKGEGRKRMGKEKNETMNEKNGERRKKGDETHPPPYQRNV